MGRKVRVTLRPDEAIEVDDTEYTDLQRHGLLVEGNTGPKSKAPESAPGPAPSDKEK